MTNNGIELFVKNMGDDGKVKSTQVEISWCISDALAEQIKNYIEHNDWVCLCLEYEKKEENFQRIFIDPFQDQQTVGVVFLKPGKYHVIAKMLFGESKIQRMGTRHDKMRGYYFFNLYPKISNGGSIEFEVPPNVFIKNTFDRKILSFPDDEEFTGFANYAELWKCRIFSYTLKYPLFVILLSLFYIFLALKWMIIAFCKVSRYACNVVACLVTRAIHIKVFTEAGRVLCLVCKRVSCDVSDTLKARVETLRTKRAVKKKIAIAMLKDKIDCLKCSQNDKHTK